MRLGVVFTAVSALIFAACGGGGTSSTSGTSGNTQGGTATVNMGTAPDSLDPQSGYTTQAAEADWLAYTGLLTYAHANGQGGTQVIPGLAQAAIERLLFRPRAIARAIELGSAPTS